jgi:hypothetical protein
MQRYTRTLIEEETNLSNMIELALKQNAKEDQENTGIEDDIVDEDSLIDLDDIEEELKDSDYEEFADFLEEEALEDLNLLLEDN